MHQANINLLLTGGVFTAIILFAAVKVLWGAAQWVKKTEHRIGERWGDEPVEVREWSGGNGFVVAGGELWRAISTDPLRPGDKVYVRKTKGLTLEVRKG